MGAANDSQTEQAARAEAKRNKALADPLRIRLHRYLLEHGTATPGEMSKALGESLDAVSYHMGQLVKYGQAELVEKRPGGNGLPASVYRPIGRIVIEADEVDLVGPDAMEGFNREFVTVVSGQLREGIRSGSIDERKDRVLAVFSPSVDEQGWEELREAHAEAVAKIYEIEERSANRCAKSGEPTIRVASSQMLFPMPDAGD